MRYYLASVNLVRTYVCINLTSTVSNHTRLKSMAILGGGLDAVFVLLVFKMLVFRTWEWLLAVLNSQLLLLTVDDVEWLLPDPES